MVEGVSKKPVAFLDEGAIFIHVRPNEFSEETQLTASSTLRTSQLGIQCFSV
jgi:hypothetical protein